MAAPAPSPQKITLVTAQGHVHDMWEPVDYAVSVTKAEDPNVFYWQPIGDWDAFALPLGPPCDAGFADGQRLI